MVSLLPKAQSADMLREELARVQADLAGAQERQRLRAEIAKTKLELRAVNGWASQFGSLKPVHLYGGGALGGAILGFLALGNLGVVVGAGGGLALVWWLLRKKGGRQF